MKGLSALEYAIVDRCSGEPMLDQVQTWAAINSGSANLDGLAKMAGILADAFSVLPGKLRFVEPAESPIMANDGTLRELPLGQNLHLTVRPDAPVQLLLTGHMDTVYGIDHAFQGIKWRKPGVLGGPGVADMKSGIAIILAALKSVEGSPAAARLGYEVVINSDEEVGSPGSAALIAQAARRKSVAFTYEPSVLPDGTLAGARPGSGNFSIRIRGRSAHAGRNPEDGRNAVVAAADLVVRLAALARPGLKVNPARIDGGGPNNVVPDHAIVRVNLRPTSTADQDRTETQLRSAADAIARAHDVKVDVHGQFGRPPKPLDPAAQRLFAFVQSCGADLGQTLAWRDSGGVCDGNNIAACGVPVVDTMGARGGAIHSTEEYLIVDSLVERAQLSALAIHRIAAGEGS